METVKLKVTSRVINQTQNAQNQEQIAITEPSGPLASVIAAANSENRINVIFASALSLVLGDTGAIWRAHNRGNEDAFDGLFEFVYSIAD